MKKKTSCGRASLPGAWVAGIIVIAFPLLAFAGNSRDTVWRALCDELQRSMAWLKMDGMDRPYYIAYTVIELDQLSIQASFGAVKQSERNQSRFLKTDVRVGSYAFDNSNFVPSSYDTYSLGNFSLLPVEDDYAALRQYIWYATDMAYKSALDMFSRKKGYCKNLASNEGIDSFAPAGQPQMAILPEETENISESPWISRCRDISAIFRKYPLVQNSVANFSWVRVRKYFINSEGARKFEPHGLVSLQVNAAAQAADGMKLVDTSDYTADSLSRFPSKDQIAAGTHAMARELSDRCLGETLESYCGPVIFEDQAAAEFFRQLLARNLCLQPSLLFEDSYYRPPESRLKNKRNLRILPDSFDVVADPLQSVTNGFPLLGAYRVDDEGVAAQRVMLVEKGVLKNFLLSRSPVKGFPGSNGHGRTSVFDRVRTRISNLFVTVNSPKTSDQIRNEMIQLLRLQGLDFGIVVRSLTRTDDDAPLSPPLGLYKLYVDGRMQPLRGMEFTGVTVRLLKDILAAGGEKIYHFFDTSPEVAATMVVPAIVLVEEIELKKTGEPKAKPPILPHPFFSTKKPVRGSSDYEQKKGDNP